MADGSPPTDEQLVARARKGDTQAFEALCTRYEGLLRARARHWIAGAVRRRVSLADVLQETYLHAHGRLHEFDDRGEGAFGAWLARITDYKAREAVRHHAGVAMRDATREARRDARPDMDQTRGHDPSPSEAAIAHEEMGAVHSAMDALSDDHRTVLELVRFENLPLQETAVLMGRTYEATKKLYGRAVAALARELKRPATN
jgi:RNA polymerase sigma-70 factor (ECF subfamily)